MVRMLWLATENVHFFLILWNKNGADVDVKNVTQHTQSKTAIIEGGGTSLEACSNVLFIITTVFQVQLAEVLVKLFV